MVSMQKYLKLFLGSKTIFFSIILNYLIPPQFFWLPSLTPQLIILPH